MLSVEDQFESGHQLQLFSCSLAQLVEHSTDNRVVAGSSPARTTKDLMRLKLNWMSSGLLHHRLQVRILSGVPNNLRVWYKGCTLAFQAKEDQFESGYPLQIRFLGIILDIRFI